MRCVKAFNVPARPERHFLRTVIAVTALGVSAAAAGAAQKVTGVWIDDTGKGAVKIEVCNGSALCGHIVWIKDPLKKNGQPLTDELNPEPSKRKRLICGLQILGGLEKISEGGFDNGWVYDPKRGAQYDVALDMLSSNKLQVTGYKGMRMFGQSFVWTRAPADLPTCSNDQASTPKSETKKPAKTAKAEKHKGTSSKVSGDETGSSGKPRKTASEADN